MCVCSSTGCVIYQKRDVFSCLWVFCLGHMKSCSLQLLVPAGRSEIETVDKKGHVGQIAGFQPFLCTMVASSLASSPAAASGQPRAQVAALRQCRDTLSWSPNVPGAVVAPGRGRDAARGARSRYPMIPAPNRAVPYFAWMTRWIFMRGHPCSDTA